MLGFAPNITNADSFEKVEIIGKIIEIDTPIVENKNNAEKWKISDSNGEETLLVKNATGEITYFTKDLEQINNILEDKKENNTINQEDLDCKSKKGRVEDLGIFKITHYCSCTYCCGKNGGHTTRSGTKPTIKRTVAVDPKVIPLGTKIIIDGEEYIAEDTGSAVKNNVIDIYVGSHSEAKQLGVFYTNVYKPLKQ